METYVDEVLARLNSVCPDHRTWVFGHAGDGNLHFVIANAPREQAEPAVYEPLQAVGGSISGEHGIGMEKRPWLPVSRNEAEIELMQKLKRSLDPQDILNPGRVIQAEHSS